MRNSAPVQPGVGSGHREPAASLMCCCNCRRSGVGEGKRGAEDAEQLEPRVSVTILGCLFLERRLLVPRLSQAWCRVSVNFLFLVTEGNRWDGDESQARQLQVLSL